jgi:hypothetical protein
MIISTDISRLKALLRLTSSRLQVLKQRLEAQARVVRSQLYKNRNVTEKQAESLARVQMLIRDDYLQEAYTILESHCQVLLNNLGDLLLIVGEKMEESNAILRTSIGTVIYAADKLAKIPELKAIRELFSSKLSDFEADSDFLKKFSVVHPSQELCQKYLDTIYETFGVDNSVRDDKIETGDFEVDGAESLETRFSALRRPNS